jgi:hypothetical protein
VDTLSPPVREAEPQRLVDMSPATGFARALLQTRMNNTACAEALALADADAL